QLAVAARDRLLPALGGLVCALVGSAAAVAAEPKEGGGLPQFDVSTFASQIFWLILACWALYYLLVRRGLPPIPSILQERQSRITADLDRAAALRREAEERLHRYEAMVAEAHAGAREQVQTSQDRLTEEFARRQAALDGELTAKRRDAERRVSA